MLSLVLADEASVEKTLRTSTFGQTDTNRCYVQQIVRTLREAGVYGREDISMEEMANLFAGSLRSVVAAMPALRHSVRLMAHEVISGLVETLFPNLNAGEQAALALRATTLYVP